jgi:ATP-binding cassette subfamily B protein
VTICKEAKSHMNMPKKYSSIDFILLSIRIIPIQSIFAIVYTAINALMPVYQTIALANFINCVIDIFSGNKETSDIIFPILLIVLYIIFTNLMPAISDIVSLTGKNRLTLRLKGMILDKKSLLEYMHVENTETMELINRACSDPVGNFISGFNNILSAANLIISSISLLIVVMTSTVIGGLLIAAVSMPLFFLALRTGKRNYEMEKEAKKIQRKYKYLSSVLTGREFAKERALFGYSNSIQNKFKELYYRSFKVESKIEKRSYANMKSGSLVTLLIIAVIVLILLPSLNNGTMSMGTFIALVNAVFSLVQSMSWQLSGTMREHSRLKEYLKDLNAFFALSEKKDACAIPGSGLKFDFKTLEFRNVSFKYPGTEVYILKNCSFIMQNGKSYALVGVNGAGKSTIAKLIVGMYDCFEGDI